MGATFRYTVRDPLEVGHNPSATEGGVSDGTGRTLFLIMDNNSSRPNF